MKCKWCGKVISKKGGRYDRKIYCDSTCGFKYYRREMGDVNIIQNRKNMGTYSELIVCCDLLKKGFDVFKSVSPYASFDLVAHKNSRLIKIEVKTGYLNKNTNRICHSKPSNNEYDLVGVFVKTDLSVRYFDKNKVAIDVE